MEMENEQKTNFTYKKSNHDFCKLIKIKDIVTGKNSRIQGYQLDSLMSSIKEVGLLQPIGVYKNKSNQYEIVYGNRRFWACSKLGFTEVPALLIENKEEYERDLKNLTENIQRRDITLTEIGRYIFLLEKAGLGQKEIAVRLGKPVNYVQSCLKSYKFVPKSMIDDVDASMSGGKGKKKGKITFNATKAIVSAVKNKNISRKDSVRLFKAAKSDDRFNTKDMHAYVSAIAQGKKDFLSAGLNTKLKYHTLQFTTTKKLATELHNKYVVKGKYRNINHLFMEILRDNEKCKVKIFVRR